MNEEYEGMIDRRMALALALRDAGIEASEDAIDKTLSSLDNNNWRLDYNANPTWAYLDYIQRESDKAHREASDV